MSAIGDLIAAAARRNGVDPATLTAIGKIESGLNPAARNPRSSAGGLFQFIDSTAQRYGLTNKFDAGASADAAARLTRDNAAFLARALGRQATPGELYLAHQQGAGGAASLLRDPSVPAAQVVGARAVSLNGGTPGISAGDFAAKWTNKLQAALGAPAPATESPTGQAPQAGTALAQALPGASLPVFSLGPDPAVLAAALTPTTPQIDVAALQQEQRRNTDQQRRRALLSVGAAFA